MKRLLFIDNFDSFTYNVVHLLAENGAQLDVKLNDDPELTAQALNDYDALVVGPGPGNPSQKPQMMEVLHAAIERKMPVLGVCLGLQAIGEAYGASVVHAPHVMHGKTSKIAHDNSGIFRDVPTPITCTRYHSLCLDESTLPASLAVVAHSEDGVVQAIRATDAPVYGVQFHPESVLSEQGDTLVRNFIDTIAERE
jgi:anthranilate synthase/aminodeoxychorismate synthase-like glutamine amidotransferase